MVVPHSPRRPTHTPLRELSPSEAVDGDDWGSSPSTLARTVASGPPPRPGFTHPRKRVRFKHRPRSAHRQPSRNHPRSTPARITQAPSPRARHQRPLGSSRAQPSPGHAPGHTQDHQPDANTDQPASARSGPSPPAHSRSPARYRRPHRSTRLSPAGAMLPPSAPAASPASASTRITRPSAPAHRVRRRTPRRSPRSPGAGWSAAATRPGPWPRSGSAPRAGG